VHVTGRHVALILLAASFGSVAGWAQSDAESARGTFNVLLSLRGGKVGGLPAALTFDPSGLIYGTAFYGGGVKGCGNLGCGFVYQLAPPASPGGEWTKTVILQLDGGADGRNASDLLLRDGVLYGTAGGGSSTHCGATGCGIVFQLSPPSAPGGTWTETVLHSFDHEDGAFASGLAMASDGTLYGITARGGAADLGTVYQLAPPASPGAAWTFKSLYSFEGKQDGAWPVERPALGPNGVIYGTTAEDIDSDTNGTVYMLTPPAAGGKWKHTVLYGFAGGDDGNNPSSSLAIDGNGVLYGETSAGGTANAGTVYALAPPASPGGSWTHTVIYNFLWGRDGYQPESKPILAHGSLYGVTIDGGGSKSCASGCGTIFRLKPPAEPGGSWDESILFRFALQDGAGAVDLQMNQGAFYGFTSYGPGKGPHLGFGTVFQFIP
jgi:uncharacterized repeat protein (TIGR03803 family)